MKSRVQVKEFKIKEKIQSVLEEGDILFIIPPFAIKNLAVLGPHILQSIAEEMGQKAEVLYLNILFASIIGDEIYDKISTYSYNLRSMMKLGERLFARSAHGLPPLGKSAELIFDETKGIVNNKEKHKKAVYDPKIFNLDDLLDLEEICFSFVVETVKVIASFNYKIIGCSTTLEQTNSSVALLKGIKKIRPDIISLMGGKNCDGEMAEGIASLSYKIDYVFSGESEISFKEFLKGYRKTRLPEQRIIKSEPLIDLNTLPLPNYESFFKQTEQFFGKNLPKQILISYEASRGCYRGQKQKCYFCGNNYNHSILFRQKSEKKVMKELDLIKNNYPASGIFMADDSLPSSYYKKLLPFLSQKKESLPIWYQEKSNLKLKALITLKKARINATFFGIEALSTDLLKLMNKGINAAQNLLLLRYTLSVGLYIQWNMLWGFPGDRVTHYHDTLKILTLISHFQPPLDIICMRLVRFSHYVENPQLHQITNLRPLEIYKQIYPEGTEIDKLAYEFTADYPCESHEHPELIREIADQVETWKKSWKTSTLKMIPFSNYFIVYDSRGINGKNKNHILDSARAKEIMVYCIYNGSENQKWAVKEKLGVVVDSWYVPLVTASPELLLEFEE